MSDEVKPTEVKLPTRTLREEVDLQTKNAEAICNAFWQALAKAQADGSPPTPAEAILGAMYFIDALKSKMSKPGFNEARSWARFLRVGAPIKAVPVEVTDAGQPS